MTAVAERTTAEHWASYSQLGTHRACPQRWFYSSVKRLEKIESDEVKVELEFGLWWHALRAADSLVRGRLHDSLKAVPREIRTVDGGPTISTTVDLPHSAVLEAAEGWWNTLTPRVHDVWRERLGWEDLATGLRYVDEQWNEMWAEDLQYERPLAFEYSWRRMLPSLPGPRGDLDPNTVLVGYVDEIFQDVRRNLVVARDHKAHKKLDIMSAVDDMMDSQLQLYAWGASPGIAEWGLGPIRATAYDRICMVAPRPPQLTLSGRLKIVNGQAAVGSCDLRTYLEWAEGEDGQGVPFPGTKKDGSGAGFYTAEEAIVERLSRPSTQSAWFQRTRRPLNANIVKTHLRSSVESAFDMINTRERSEVSGQAGRNLGGNCRWCDFAGLCRAQLIGGPDGDYDLAEFGLRERD